MDSDVCAVCLEPLTSACRLPCGHTLDAHCLLRVLAASYTNGTNAHSGGAPCPCCRVPFARTDVVTPARLFGMLRRRAPLRSVDEAIALASREYETARRQHLARVPSYVALMVCLLIICATVALLCSAYVLLSEAVQHVPPSGDALSVSTPMRMAASGSMAQETHQETAQDSTQGVPLDVRWLRSSCERWRTALADDAMVHERVERKRGGSDRKRREETGALSSTEVDGGVLGGVLSGRLVGQVAGELLVGGFFGEFLGGLMGIAIETSAIDGVTAVRRSAEPSPPPQASPMPRPSSQSSSLPARCATLWLNDAQASLRQHHHHHAISYARHALDAATTAAAARPTAATAATTTATTAAATAATAATATAAMPHSHAAVHSLVARVQWVLAMALEAREEAREEARAEAREEVMQLLRASSSSGLAEAQKALGNAWERVGVRVQAAGDWQWSLSNAHSPMIAF